MTREEVRIFLLGTLTGVVVMCIVSTVYLIATGYLRT